MTISVFISHHSSQYASASKVKTALEEAGINGWLAPDDIAPGATFDTAIMDAIARSDAIILLLCKHSDQSRHVKRELIAADDLHKPIYPVRLANLTPGGLSYWLKDQQWTDWFNGTGAGLDRLIETIQKRSGSHGGAGAVNALSKAPGSFVPPVRQRWPRRWWIGGGAALTVVLAGGAYFLFQAKPWADQVIAPGLWRNTFKVTQIVYPKLPAEGEAQLRALLEQNKNPDDCVTESTARDPLQLMARMTGEAKCTRAGFQMANGQVTGSFSCPIPDVEDGQLQVSVTGTYTRTTINADQDVVMQRPDMTVRFKGHEESKWVSQDCAAIGTGE